MTATPAVTTFTDTAGDHVLGVVVILLSPDLAGRMNEFIHRRTECPAGHNFGQVLGSNSKFRARADGLGAAICGVQGIVANAAPGTAFVDFLVVRPGALQWNEADVIRAMNVAVQFTRRLRASPTARPGDGCHVRPGLGRLTKHQVLVTTGDFG
ncbi:uncharacterized protein BP5553_10402 [Venustampulla echinocandica]|uniref:Uncharacterized protein n=1 Tax=Venustampulla echinocandica TaxID=2656787 RepID=A0A370T977_9HELO|nr:uncharacterized protein BP5553_10402 [Venustampulla echinocandica]RDL30124.1 hypothetical protein BP5553_10402 [Venustampulla echinocandica]